jgi:hypothetical protein
VTDLRSELQRATAAAGRDDVDVTAVRARGEQLRRHRRTFRGAAAAGVAVAFATGALIVVTSPSGEHDLRTVDRPEATTTTTASTLVPPVSAVTPPSLTSTSTTAGGGGAPDTTTSTVASTTKERQRVVEDAAGDATGEPAGSQPNDATLDLLALDVAWTGEHITFVHVLAGPPAQQPSGADGRAHDTWFRIPGHNLVNIAVQTYELDERVLIGVTGDGYMPPALRCQDCTVELDVEANEVRVVVPINTLNSYLREHDGGELRPGVTVSGWEAETRKEHTTRRYADEQESPHFYTATVMDRIRAYAHTWDVPSP